MRLDEQGTVLFEQTSDATLIVRLSGSWCLRNDMPPASLLAQQLRVTTPKRVLFDSSPITNWDSSLISFLTQSSDVCRAQGIEQDRGGLQDGLRHLVELAEAVPEKKGARSDSVRPSFFTRVGNASLGYGLSVGEFLGFLGELSVALVQFVRGKARYRRVDMLEAIQQCGAEAVGIVAWSASWSASFSPSWARCSCEVRRSIYVADLVGIGMVRDMGAMMTAIIMSGRTGAAFAAKLGTMKVTQEIDALDTMGISPMEFLVLPRVLALILMMPLLCPYADIVGILGGPSSEPACWVCRSRSYMLETISTLTLAGLFGGLLRPRPMVY